MSGDALGGGARVRFGVLGPLEVRVDGQALPLGGVKPRAVLALLLIDANRVVSTGRIITALWGDDAGERAPSTLQVHVSNLRKALAPAASALGVEELVVTRRPGYLVTIDGAALDLVEFRDLVAAGQLQVGRSDLDAAAQSFASALALVRGEPLGDLSDDAYVAPIATHLQQQVEHARSARFETELALGHHREVLGELAAAVEAAPLDEHLRALHMLALYRGGRQADALAAYQEARRTLVEELGVDPSPELRELEGRMLEQDPALAAPPARGGVATGAVRPPGPPRGDSRTVLRTSVLVPAAVLVVAGDEPRTIVLTRPVTTIGRREGNDVVLDDPQASRAHAEVRSDAGRFVVLDLQSTNGTRVNGEAVGERELRSGDEIQIGAHRLRFERLGD